MKRALIVIDVQQSFAQRAMWEHNSNRRLVEQVNRLVDAARAFATIRSVAELVGEPIAL